MNSRERKCNDYADCDAVRYRHRPPLDLHRYETGDEDACRRADAHQQTIAARISVAAVKVSSAAKARRSILSHAVSLSPRGPRGKSAQGSTPRNLVKGLGEESSDGDRQRCGRIGPVNLGLSRILQ